tara:strand:- start:117770 stop:118630 length:861 start_codon:yes stop_codon:yes gene_type:complete
MVAYEDLVVALTNWRINQGLPTGADAFAAFESGSVDLALPVADPVELNPVELNPVELNPVELNADEVLAIDDDSGIEEVLDEGYEAIAEDEGVEIESAEIESAESFIDEQAGEAIEAQAESLDYGEETAYGEMPDMDGTPPMPAPLEAGEAIEELAAEQLEPAPAVEMSADDALVEEFSEIDANEIQAEEIAIDAAGADEVIEDALDIEEVDASAVAEEYAVGEPVEVADALAIEEEVDADDFEAVEVDAEDFEVDEVPTKFGGENGEQTVMGIGVDQIVAPDEEG